MALNPTTELEAINAMLATIGESPVASIDTSLPDVAMAQNVLNAAQREVCSRRWRFNTEFGYSLTPSGTQGALNVYEVPSDLLGFDLTRTPEQSGMDVILRPSRTYNGGGTLIFYDRLNAAEGFSLVTLKIDPVWLLDYEYSPQSARSYVATMAARRFQGQVKGSEVLHKITAEDEQEALAVLEEDQKMASPVVPDGTPHTETGVVNLMLTAAGQEPIASVDAPVGRAASQAINVLRTASSEILSQRWRFNSEYGYTLTPSSTYLDTSGSTLNVFEVPEGLSGFRLTRSPSQRGKDAVRRASRVSPGTTIIADRLSGEDGWAQDTLQIDPVWLLPFDELPEAARSYITVYAIRRYLGRPEGQEVSGFTAEDEQAALVSLHQSEIQLASTTDSGGDQTEEDAVNQMIASVGGAPVVSVDAVLTPAAADAVNLLRQAVREVCAEGWSFNTEHGYEVLPSGEYDWTNHFDETYTLNVFPAPSGLLSFDVTTVEFQQGSNYLDLAIRNARESGVEGKVFIDRATNRDGHLREAIYIDPVWLLVWEELPEEAKHYALVLASRRFAGNKAPYDRRDEILARRSLKRSYGSTDNYNIFDNASVRRVLGGRPLGPSGAFDHRATGG